LEQVILAARDNGNNASWMQLLFLVVLAVFYILGSITKAKARKLEEEKKQPGQKPSPKLPSRAPSKPFQKAPSREIPATDSTQPMPYLEIRPKGRKITRPRPAEKKFIPEKPHRTKELVTSAEFSLKGKPPGTYVQPQQPTTNIRNLLTLKSPADLRRAILHYEILGKPVSLRSPSEHTMSF